MSIHGKARGSVAKEGADTSQSFRANGVQGMRNVQPEYKEVKTLWRHSVHTTHLEKEYREIVVRIV
jgi:hypothetical protein